MSENDHATVLLYPQVVNMIAQGKPFLTTTEASGCVMISQSTKFFPTIGAEKR
jgi:hypothetical protein